MIEKLKIKNNIDLLDFFNTTYDKFNDFYITKDKQRIYLKNNLYLIKKFLRNQEVYGFIDKELKGIFTLYRTKGFRPYLKILGKDNKVTKDLIKFIIWNFSNIDLYIKLKKDNPLGGILQSYGFKYIGNRGTFDKPGSEILLFRQKNKFTKVGEKNKVDKDE
jgi:hypothetical protein